MLITYNSVTYDEQYFAQYANIKTPSCKYNHSVLEIFFVISGEVKMTIDNKNHLLHSNELIFIPHNKIFKKDFDSVKKSKLIRIIFWNNNEKYWESNQHNIEMKVIEDLFPKVIKITKAIEHLLKTIKLLIPNLGYNNIGEEKQPILMNLGESILSILSLGHNSNIEINPFVLKALDYINSKYHIDISLDDIAMHTCLGKRQLLNLFKESPFDTPIKYLWNRRIQEAIQLLKYSDMEIKEIAWITGFSNISHFHRRIKTSTGLSPKKFKELQFPL